MRKMKRLTSVFALLLVASLLVSNAEVLANIIHILMIAGMLTVSLRMLIRLSE